MTDHHSLDDIQPGETLGDFLDRYLGEEPTHVSALSETTGEIVELPITGWVCPRSDGIDEDDYPIFEAPEGYDVEPLNGCPCEWRLVPAKPEDPEAKALRDSYMIELTKPNYILPPSLRLFRRLRDWWVTRRYVAESRRLAGHLAKGAAER